MELNLSDADLQKMLQSSGENDVEEALRGLMNSGLVDMSHCTSSSEHD